MPADSTEEILAVQAERQKNDRGWGIDRTEEYNVNTTAERYEKTEHYYYAQKKKLILGGVHSPLLNTRYITNRGVTGVYYLRV